MKIKLVLMILFILVSINLVNAIDIIDCSNLNQNGTYYNLTQSLTSEGNCFEITGNNIILNLRGYEIIGDSTGKGIYVLGENVTIKNGIISNFSDGIENSHLNSIIENMLLINNTVGINIETQDNYFNNITLINNSYGLHIKYGNNNIINDILADNNYIGIFLYETDNNVLSNSSFLNNNKGLLIFNSNNNTINNNNFTNNILDLHLINSIDNYFKNISIISNYLRFLEIGSNSLVNDINTSITINDKPIKYIDGFYNSCPNNQILDYNDTYSIIFFIGCDNITLKNTNVDYGIELYGVNNSYFYNINSSMSLEESNNNILYNITSINKAGLSLGGSNNLLKNITSKNNYIGLINYGNNNTLVNFLGENNENGLYLENSKNSNIINSTLINNEIGILFIVNSSNNNISNIRIINSSKFGIFFDGELAEYEGYSQNNLFFDNFFNNDINFYSNYSNKSNYFNTSLSLRKNIINGSYSGGNFWATPNGSGFSETCNDLDENGICDDYYNLTNGIDYLPLCKIILLPNITITSPTDSILILPTWQDEYNWSWYNVTVNFTTNVPTTCEENFAGTSVSSPPSCQPAYCDNNGCAYVCSSGGSGGGGISYQSIAESLTTTHSYVKSVLGIKNKHYIRCYDEYNNSVSAISNQYLPRENNLTVEWAKFLRPVLSINQSINFISSVTNYYNLTSVNFTLTLPNTSVINYDYLVNIGQNVDKRYDKNFNNTSQIGQYALNVTYYDINDNIVNETLTFSVYESLLKYFNTTKGGYGFSVRIKDPSTGAVINVGNSSGGGGMSLPKTKVDIEIEPTNNTDSIVRLSQINLSAYDINPNGETLNISNISDSTKSVGTGSGFRYKPLNAEAIEIENFTQFNSSAIYQFDYSNLNILDPNKIVIFKSDYDFNTSTTNYSSGHFYKINDSTYPLYLNETGEYVYINITSFSSFILTEDQSTTEVCGNGIDDDFVGGDETCPVDDDSGSSPSGGSGGAGGGSISLSKVSLTISVMDKSNDTLINITSDELGLYGAIIKVNDKMENVKFTFEKFDIKPTGTTEPVSKEKVFKYIEITQSIGKENIDTATLKFKIEKKWLTNNSIEKELVRMYRFTTKWDELSTTISKEDSGYVYFESETPGFSYFKISALEKEEEIINNHVTQEVNDEILDDTEKTIINTNKIIEDNQELEKSNIFIIVLIFFLLILFIVAYIYYINIEKNELNIIKKYLKEEKEDNIDINITIKNLLNKGWSEEIVDKAINDLNNKE
jgi:PGF-pre-PGF domain-containing protein